jgi:hypothetical protein
LSIHSQMWTDNYSNHFSISIATEFIQKQSFNKSELVKHLKGYPCN